MLCCIFIQPMPAGRAKAFGLSEPALSDWTEVGSLNTPRMYPTATLLLNGKVLVAGGQPSESETATASAELYDPSTRSWTTIPSMNAARHGHTATLLSSGKVLVAGGYNVGYLNSAEVYDPVLNTWTPVASMDTSPPLSHGDDTAETARCSWRVALIGGLS